MHVPTSPLDILQKAIYLIQKTSYSPCGTFLFRTKPIFVLNACAEQQALVSTTYQVEDTFHTRSDTNVKCLSLRYNPNKSYARSRYLTSHTKLKCSVRETFGHGSKILVLLKRVQKFAKQAKTVSQRARITSLVGK